LIGRIEISVIEFVRNRIPVSTKKPPSTFSTVAK
jgi:hypothetical protein